MKAKRILAKKKVAAVSSENDGAPVPSNKLSTQDIATTSKDETQADSSVAKKKQALKKKVTPLVTKSDTEKSETPSADLKAKTPVKRKAEKELEEVPKKKKKIAKDANEKEPVKTNAATGKRILNKKAVVPDKKTVADKSAADAAEQDISISQPFTTRKEQIKADEPKGKQRVLNKKKKMIVSKKKAVPAVPVVTTNQDDDDTDVEGEGEDTRTQIHVDDEITLNISDASLSHMRNMKMEESKATGLNKAKEKPAVKKTNIKKSVRGKNQENISTPGPSKADPSEAGPVELIKKKEKLGEAGDTGRPVSKKKKEKLGEAEDRGKPVVKKKKKLVGGAAAGRKGRSGANTRSVDLHL